MAVLTFTLTADAAAQIHDVLTCLSKFSDSVYVEGRQDRLVLSALNPTRSGYEFASPSGRVDRRFTCQIFNKALSSVFKGRLADSRGGETALERCEVIVQEEIENVACRFIIKLICRHGVTKTYKLTYESVEVMQALFNKSAAPNIFQISAKMLKEYSEYFAPKAEQLGIYAEDGRVTFASFTEKIMEGKEILKQPLHTAVSIDIKDFEEYSAEEKIHIIISVKDFKAIASHAESLGVALRAQYSQPNRPLQFSYSTGGMKCEFTLMTTGNSRSSSIPRQTEAATERAQTRSSEAPSTRSTNRSTGRSELAPSAAPASRVMSRQRNLGSASRAVPLRPDPDSNSLFVPAADDDSRWQPLEEQEEHGDYLGWDASDERDSALQSHFGSNRRVAGLDGQGGPDIPVVPTDGVEPTQRVSQIRGLFD
ncbi:MAG: hypothetical protein M1822_009657 [Bathelium mastoideum]|nr:MAG: hypothetical protein M1822_009657 [Bathelium mastoideum]